MWKTDVLLDLDHFLPTVKHLNMLKMHCFYRLLAIWKINLVKSYKHALLPGDSRIFEGRTMLYFL